ncbi:MAG: hypothetical protein LUE86_11625 [Clostridiales bacterium]|nr:hypothetical protein [Clostridiales bacterium]
MRRTSKATPEGVVIKMLLLTSNLTAKELAGRIGKTEATSCDVISGKNKSRKTLKMILDVLCETEESAKVLEFLQLFEKQFRETNALEASEEKNPSMEPVVE